MRSSPNIFAAPGDHRHLNPLGVPCLTFGGYVKAEGGTTSSIFGPAVQPSPLKQSGALPPATIYEHEVRVTNSCGQNIKVRLCYYKTDECITVDVAPWEQKYAVLGIFPGLPDFRFQAREQF